MIREKPALKILHIDPEKNWGGGESQVLGLLSCLSERRHLNHLACDPNGLLFPRAQSHGILTIPVSIRNEIDLRPVWSLRRRVQREGYDIVHFHTKRAHALAPWLRIRTQGPTFLVTRRMDYPVRKNWYTRYLYNRYVDGVVAISQKIADLLIEAGVEREKIRVIHSGIDPNLFAQKEGSSRDKAGPLVIGTAAVLEERKGHRFLLEAAALLKREGYSLCYWFAGEGSQRERLQKQAVTLGLGENVSFLGFISDIQKFLSQIDIFVLPSLYEGLGISVLEAMAAGKPVVVTRVGGLSELVESGKSGWLVLPADPRALADSIAKLVREKDLRTDLGKNATERVCQRFTMEQMALKNEAYYYDLLGCRT